MELILLFAFGTIGLTHILSDGDIFQPIREKIAANKKLQWLSKLIECYQCCGFWAGLFVGLLIFGFNPPVVLVCGFASSFLARLGGNYLDYLDSLTSIDLDSLNEE
jgi:hypothetical protein